MDRKMLIIKASKDIDQAEINNIASQASLYGIETTIKEILSLKMLYDALKGGISYEYIYLATHACETTFGNRDNTIDIKWLDFAALVCVTEVTQQGAIFMHSCCRGGLNQVAFQMFGCCNTIEFVCGPRHSLSSRDLVTAFNLFLYNVEVKKIDPVRSAEKVMHATDVRLVCFDRLEVDTDFTYKMHCERIKEEIAESFSKAFQMAGMAR